MAQALQSDIDTGQKTRTWLAVSDEPAALVSGRYSHHQQQEQSARQAMDSEFVHRLVAKLGVLTGIALP